MPPEIGKPFSRGTVMEEDQGNFLSRVPIWVWIGIGVVVLFVLWQKLSGGTNSNQPIATTQPTAGSPYTDLGAALAQILANQQAMNNLLGNGGSGSGGGGGNGGTCGQAGQPACTSCPPGTILVAGTCQTVGSGGGGGGTGGGGGGTGGGSGAGCPPGFSLVGGACVANRGTNPSPTPGPFPIPSPQSRGGAGGGTSGVGGVGGGRGSNPSTGYTVAGLSSFLGTSNSGGSPLAQPAVTVQPSNGTMPTLATNAFSRAGARGG